MAGASLVAQRAGKVGKHSNWRNSQAFSGEFDAIEGNETQPRTESVAHLGAILRVRRPQTPRDVEGQPDGGGAKIINGLILRIRRFDVILCLTY